MPRRVRVPASDELFRPTAVEDAVDPQPGAVVELADAKARPSGGRQHEQGPRASEPEARPPEPAPPERAASGRVRHDEKMTVYVTSDELLDIEQARLELRRALGRAVDRGRLVRAAVALALADLDEHGPDSALVRRLEEA